MYKGVVCLQVVCVQGVCEGVSSVCEVCEIRECVQRCSVFTSGV